MINKNPANQHEFSDAIEFEERMKKTPNFQGYFINNGNFISEVERGKKHFLDFQENNESFESELTKRVTTEIERTEEQTERILPYEDLFRAYNLMREYVSSEIAIDSKGDLNPMYLFGIGG